MIKAPLDFLRDMASIGLDWVKTFWSIHWVAILWITGGVCSFFLLLLLIRQQLATNRKMRELEQQLIAREEKRNPSNPSGRPPDDR